MDLLAESISEAILMAPIENIDLTEWLFTLKDAEYRACSTAHIAGGTSLTENGERISINVELIESNLLVQHYREDISQRNHCRVNSVSDSISPLGHTKLGITWELTVEKINENTSRLVNHVLVHQTSDFAAQLERLGITDLLSVQAKMKEHLEAHNAEETPGFARDIERKALEKKWW